MNSSVDTTAGETSGAKIEILNRPNTLELPLPNANPPTVRTASLDDDRFHSMATPRDGLSLASLQLATGFLQIFEPSLVHVKGQLKELIGKQNKIYIDLSTEKFKLDNFEMAKLNEMMYTVKIYREKLLKIRKHMQNIYQRTKVLKKRATHIQACKQKELQRKLQKQQQEESLIGGGK